MISSYTFIVMGMALVSMCWNLVQLKLQRFADNLARRIEKAVPLAEERDAVKLSTSTSTLEQLDVNVAAARIVGG